MEARKRPKWQKTARQQPRSGEQANMMTRLRVDSRAAAALSKQKQA
jgi:hypothetical protein